MGKHELRPGRPAKLTKVVGLAGMATAAAALAMSVGAGTAEAGPLNNIFHPHPPGTGGSAPKAQANAATPSLASRGPDIGSVLSSIAPSIYNPGPFTIGHVTNPTLPAGSQYVGQFIVKPAVPGKQPFTAVTGFQLPFWTINPTTGAPVPAA